MPVNIDNSRSSVRLYWKFIVKFFLICCHSIIIIIILLLFSIYLFLLLFKWWIKMNIFDILCCVVFDAISICLRAAD